MGNARSQPSTSGSAAGGILLKNLMVTSPTYDGRGDTNKLFEFIQKHDSIFIVAEFNPSLELSTTISRLTGSASLWWHDHTSKYSEVKEG